MLLPIAKGQLTPFRRTLTSVYEKRIRVALLDRSGDVISVLSRAFRDGQVVVDADQEVTRAVNLTLLDPNHAFGFDADTYQGGILDLTRMLRVWWVVDGPLLARQVSIPVFTGPVTRLQRDGALLTVEGQGKEAYGLGTTKRTLVLKAGTKKTDAIRTILRELMGETRMDIPDLPARLGADVVVSRKSQAWKIAMRIAQSMTRQLYFDGAGVCHLRPRSRDPLWVFNSGENGGEITGPLSTSADKTKIINDVRVVGPKPKGKKVPIIGTATADITHPLSPWQMGPPGAPQFLTKTVDNEHIRTQAEADDLAEDILADGLNLVHEGSFTCAPIPMLDPLDMIRARTDQEVLTARLRSFTLPLGLGGEMTVGRRSTYGLFPMKDWRAA